MNIKNSIRGRKAKAAGDSFEAWLNLEHERAKRLGILAHIEKTQARTNIVDRRLIYIGKGVADYIGTLEGGRSVVLEAKSTAGTRFPRNEISMKQQEHLGVVARAGGLSLLLLEFRNLEVVRFAIPWLEVEWEILRTADSVSMCNLDSWVIKSGCYLEKYHSGGLSSSAQFGGLRRFARE